MTESECLAAMVAPGTRRAGKYREGVIQILVTSSCDKSCFNCTQGSNFSRKPWFMSPEQFEQAVRSLGFIDSKIPNAVSKYDPSTYFGVVGVFGGNPAISPHFRDYCEILRRLVPFNQRGLWCNNPLTLDLAQEMAKTFDPSVSNLNVHLDKQAYNVFKQGWPGCTPVGLTVDSRHSPVFVAMKDVVRKPCPDCGGSGGEHNGIGDEESYEFIPCPVCKNENRVQFEPGKPSLSSIPDAYRIYDFISGCDINQHWSAMIGVFRGQLRAWFCEIAGAQSILHQDEPDYPDTGVKLFPNGCYEVRVSEQEVTCGLERSIRWWQLGMNHFEQQVRKHCFDCGVPLRGYGELAQGDAPVTLSSGKVLQVPDNDPKEQVSATHANVATPKRKGRQVEVVTDLVQLHVGRIGKTTHYLQNSGK